MGYFHWRSYVGPIMHRNKRMSPNPMAGYPDLSGILKTKPGKLFCLEVKKPGGKVSPKQRDWHQKLYDVGVCVAVVESVEHVESLLKLWEETE